MNRAFFLIFCIYFLNWGITPTIPTVPAKKQFTYRFNLKGSPEIDHFDGLVATYKGRWLRLSSGWCLFTDDQEIVTMNIVVLGQAPAMDNVGNTITGFSVADTTQARWFRITRRTLFEGEKIKYFWDINEVTAKKTSNKIPKNAFVIYLNPDFVENFCTQPNSLERNIIALPTLILKNTVTQEDFDEAIGECACGAIEARTVHTPPLYQENRDAQSVTLLPIS